MYSSSPAGRDDLKTNWFPHSLNAAHTVVNGGNNKLALKGIDGPLSLLFAAKVRAGFVLHVRRELLAKMKPLRTDVLPVRQSAGKTPHAVGIDARANERLRLAEARTRRAD
jgi:hypothetical protein